MFFVFKIQARKLSIKLLKPVIFIKPARCVNNGSGILFGFYQPKRYSAQRVKTPKSF